MRLASAGIRGVEVACWSLGAVLCLFFVAQLVQGEIRRVEGIEWANLAWATEPDQSLWSEARISAWEENRPDAGDPVLAVLDIPGLDLQVPVFGDSGDLAMDRGAGWIEGTAMPGQAGNIGIAGHRDGYFRALKDAETGDSLTLRTAAGSRRYIIEDILIVDPLDIEVLDPTDDQVLTLVTCYPFYFVGSAPQRYIVRARLDSPPAATLTLTRN